MVGVSTQALTQIGLVLGAIGATSIAVGAIGFLRYGGMDAGSQARERIATLAGATLVLAGFLVQLFATSR